MARKAQTTAKKSQTTTKKQNNMVAAVTYIFGLFSGLSVYLSERDDKFVRFHAMQSIIASLVVIAIWFIALLISPVLIVTLLLGGGFLFVLMWSLLILGTILVWLLLIFQAYRGIKYKLPMIGNIAERYA